MTEEPDNIVLVMLRRMDAKLDRIGVDIRAIRDILIHIEWQLAAGEE